MMGRQLGAVSPSGRVDNIWRTTQVTLEWGARITTRYSEKRIQPSSPLFLGFELILRWRLKSHWFPFPLTFT